MKKHMKQYYTQETFTQNKKPLTEDTLGKYCLYHYFSSVLFLYEIVEKKM